VVVARRPLRIELHPERLAPALDARALLADPAAKTIVKAHGAIDATTIRLSLTDEAARK